MGSLKNFVTPLHQATTRDYISRMVDDKVHCMRSLSVMVRSTGTVIAGMAMAATDTSRGDGSRLPKHSSMNMG